MYLRLEILGLYLEIGEQAAGDEYAEEADEPAVPVATSAPEAVYAEHDFEHRVPPHIGFV